LKGTDPGAEMPTVTGNYKINFDIRRLGS
jgi:hypothetical protein